MMLPGESEQPSLWLVLSPGRRAEATETAGTVERAR